MALEILFVKLLFLISLASSQVASREVILGEFNLRPTYPIVNGTSDQLLLLDNKTNIIRGWSYQGTVSYVIARNSFLIGNGLQLGPNGMISHTFYSDFNTYFFLTFRLAPTSPICANNVTAVNVSYPRFSKVFYYKESLGKETWQNHAYSFPGYDYVTLQIQSVAAVSHSNIACWPIIGELLLTGINKAEIRENNGVLFNEFWNSGFEVGPGSSSYHSQGILLEAESNLNNPSSVQLALDPWIVLGKVKYINSNRYKVPQGRRAVELISASGNPSGIAYNADYLTWRLQYTLEFIMGDAGDSCVGDFTVVVQVGSLKWNFMMKSYGVGSSKKYSVKFQLNSTHKITDAVPISFVSYNETRTSENKELCGPVIDAMYLGTSSGLRSARLPSGLAIFVLISFHGYFPPGYMVEHLRKLPQDRWLKMWKRLKEITQHFEYQYPPKKDDAVNMIWRQVRTKVPAETLAENRNQRLKKPDWSS
ncbi:hypothetical protein CTI12_AA011500 [Artemisia annua]|uniref:DUF642 domain-containing protein n=1 Tax=Artemisia annua TaxID=35608 RepID=A0A2U1QLD8_ARTAN|nr:hypothetical protein CTI12_AA011500 [Artemisia annua]